MLRIGVFLLAVAATAPAAAQKFDLQDIRKTFVNDCIARGLSRGDEAEKVNKFCPCLFDVLATNMTVAEYLEFDRAGQDGKDPATLPQVQRVMPKAAQCRQP